MFDNKVTYHGVLEYWLTYPSGAKSKYGPLGQETFLGGKVWRTGKNNSHVRKYAAGAAILYDTSKIINHYSTDLYVAASLDLFASVALMFWYVLRIFMRLSDN